jgi:radical SAM protein with 4Fe4S-binding SPASM domain
MVEQGKEPLMYEIMRRAAQRLVPLQACLELTYRCNMYCKHCYIDLPLRQDAGRELSAGEWSDVFEQLSEAGTLSLLLTGGEILTRKDFFDIAFEAKEKRFLLWLATNGTLIDAPVAARLKELRPYWIAVSLYGATAETHEAITGQTGSFEATLGGIRLLQEQGLPTTIQALLMGPNASEASEILELGADLHVGVHIGYELLPTKGCALGPQQYQATYQELEGSLAAEHLLADFPAEGPGLCKAGKGVCAISPVGDVSPCLLMPLKIGNIRERPFVELWRDEPCQELDSLRSIQREDFLECRDCELAAFCGRCPGVALGETGSLTGRPPSACHNAAIRAHLFNKERKVVYA